MQNKYGKDGLVILTVALDPPTEKDRVAKANKVIAGFKALPHNVLINGSDEEFMTRLGSDVTPTVFIFNQDNRWVKKLPEKDKEGDEIDWEYPDLDKIVEGLLKK